jgi:hypothetical protein
MGFPARFDAASGNSPAVLLKRGEPPEVILMPTVNDGA